MMELAQARPYHPFRNSRLLRAGRTGWQDTDRHHQPTAKSHDGNRILWNAAFRYSRGRGRRETSSSDGG